MSINSAMQSGVTALAANATALASISSNIANANTTGYKEMTTSFTDLVSGSASSNSYSSGGVVAVNRQSVTTQGDLNSDTSGYSLGIDGQGFFVVSDSSSDVTSGSSLLFTRDGSFSTDTDGNLVNSGGYYLLGWAADANGDITSSATDANLLVPINVSDLANTPSATTAVSFSANLNSTTTTSEAVTSNTYDPTSAALSVYDFNDRRRHQARRHHLDQRVGFSGPGAHPHHLPAEGQHRYQFLKHHLWRNAMVLRGIIGRRHLRQWPKPDHHGVHLVRFQRQSRQRKFDRRPVLGNRPDHRRFVGDFRRALGRVRSGPPRKASPWVSARTAQAA
ncbi:hypothetical protein MMA231_03054 [Asticcacaulis sp. MM231]